MTVYSNFEPIAGSGRSPLHDVIKPENDRCVYTVELMKRWVEQQKAGNPD